MDKAYDISSRNAESERSKIEERGVDNDFSDALVRAMTVYTRQDVAMLVSLLNDLNVQVRRLTVLVGAALLAAAVVAISR